MPGPSPSRDALDVQVGGGDAFVYGCSLHQAVGALEADVRLS